MTAAPHWSPVDDETSSLLSLVADLDHPSVDHEWHAYLDALRQVAGPDGVVDPNRLRPLLRGVVAPRRIGALTNKALHSDVIEYTGEWVESDDTEGRNGGKPCRQMRLLSG